MMLGNKVAVTDPRKALLKRGLVTQSVAFQAGRKASISERWRPTAKLIRNPPKASGGGSAKPRMMTSLPDASILLRDALILD